MAAITPSYVAQESEGSQTKWVCKFTTVSNNDTWTSGIKGATEFHAQVTTSGGTQASAGINVAYVASTGVFTFQPGIDAQTVTLFVYR